MEILTAYQTENRCYQKGRKASHIGILVHSTGAVNRNLCRYVDAPERLGRNKYNNHWNKAAADKCMHGFIGYDKDGVVIVANTLPYAYACWGCGKGSNGSYNYDPTAHIQFEICQGSNSDGEYYAAAIKVAAEYCAYLCRELGFSADDICSHREAARAGYASNHGDPESWMRYFGDDMAQFRARVAALLAGDADAGAVTISGTSSPDGGTTLPSTIRRGSKGSVVKELQNALMALGYHLQYGADGDFGGETLDAVEQYQRAKGLVVDGICGPKTWTAIRADLSDDSAMESGGTESGATEEPVAGAVLYTVTIPDVDAATAVYLLENYAGAVAVESEEGNG